jgi:hypothetical protein
VPNHESGGTPECNLAPCKRSFEIVAGRVSYEAVVLGKRMVRIQEAGLLSGTKFLGHCESGDEGKVVVYHQIAVPRVVDDVGEEMDGDHSLAVGPVANGTVQKGEKLTRLGSYNLLHLFDRPLLENQLWDIGNLDHSQAQGRDT